MTLSCDDARPRLTALRDGELEGEEAEALRQHLEHCAECAHVWSVGLALRAAIASAPPEETDDLLDAVSARITGGDQSRLLLTEMRLLHDEMRLLRAEVADLRCELAKRPPRPAPRSTPLSFPDTSKPAATRYRLV